VSKIHDNRQGPLGEVVSNGYYAVDPGGNIIVVPPLQKLKKGFRLATEPDFAKTPAQRLAPDEPAPEPAPAIDAPVDEIEIDASDSDQD
jgi:hypothetical protein